MFCVVYAGCCRAGQDQKVVSRPATVSAEVLKIRVASYNTQGGREKAEILKNIQSVNPDIVFLQEISPVTLKFFSKTLGMSYQFGPYGPRDTIGLGILAVGKIDPVKIFTMPGERNFALAARLQAGNREILIVSTHFKSLPRPLVSGLLKCMEPHKKQAAMIVDLVKQTKTPAIVGGDLNTLGITPAFFTLSSALRDTASAAGTSTQPSIFVSGVGYRIDHILVRGPWKVLNSQVSPLPGSDHRLIWADLELRK